METFAQLEKNYRYYSDKALRRKKQLGYIFGGITPDYIKNDTEFKFYDALSDTAFKKFQAASKANAQSRDKSLSFEERQELFKAHRAAVDACPNPDVKFVK